jgi:16S rRNA processing protein RimM
LGGGAPGASESLELESVWAHRGQLVFKFRGIDSITDAERLEGAEVRVPREQRASLPSGEYYQSDLIGCAVLDRATGDSIGTVEAFQELGAPVLEVSGAAGNEPLLIPFARAICVEIDIEGRRIVVDLPAGLKELNVR